MDKYYKNEKVEITANDGITLKGTEYIKDEQINDWVIVLHGYRSNPESVISIGRHFSEKRLQCANSIYESHWQK